MDLTLAQRLARSLMDEHGLTGWTFDFDRARVRAGACHFADRRITLSRALTAAHDEAEVRETVLHEIAHALVGPRHGHDEVWRRRAVAIGASGQRCYTADEPVVPGRWQGRCAAGHVVHRHRRPARLLLCTRCRAVPDEDRVLRWTLDGVPVDHTLLGSAVARDLEHLRARARGEAAPVGGPTMLPAGALVRITAAGRYHGVSGRVVRRGRSRYLVQVVGQRLYVPFPLVEPVRETGARARP
ncbi:SprT-like domain-containing protein [Ornithinimicrobium avium]|uniref:SprT domain-containing protein n=1 Tax=Ornithinimicrobium avium TaxID=2283195 RepID=A0A345NPM2_9MICO|nr:SprT-like domain-containing protein [Ornithinimicrobium avium]AXH96980.1 sprT domain-containing protein [Ornithinimicrobium avium]